MIGLLPHYAFIDGQNIYLGVKDAGWKVDWKKLRVLLREHYKVEQAFFFIGFIPTNQTLYTFLQQAGYVVVFKPVGWDSEKGKPKGNVDADLVLRTMIEYPNYERAVIVSSDGDFFSLVKYLEQQGKFLTVICPKREKCSKLLTRAAGGRIAYLDEFRGKIERKE